MEMSVTSGEQPAAILETNVATNTFLIRKARTEGPGSLELSRLSVPSSVQETGHAQTESEESALNGPGSLG